MTEEGLEALAAVAHEQWAGWMRVLLEQTVVDEFGERVIPEHTLRAWQTKMDTPYRKLGEAAKDAARAEARRFLATWEEVGE